MKITFLGACETVTGSMTLIETANCKILIDCGLFQGLKELRKKNRSDFLFNPKEIDAVILTHAHVDHSGLLPKLGKEGFKGDIHCTNASAHLLEYLLIDSARLQMEEAKEANEKGYSKHKPAKALYDESDVRYILKKVKSHEFEDEYSIGPLKIVHHYAGHILGASSVRVEHLGKKILFSGDIGRYEDLIMYPPVNKEQVEYVVMESTYGGHDHPQGDSITELEKICNEIIEKKKIIMIPAFAVGRAQSLLYAFYQVFQKNPKLRFPLFVDSPMTEDVSLLYDRFRGEHKLNDELCKELFNDSRFLHYTKQREKLFETEGPFGIISASGMMTGGRILHYLPHFGKNANNILLIVGYQAEGTRGADLLQDNCQIKIKGKTHHIVCQVTKLEQFSAHADQNELLHWLNEQEGLKKIYLNHGEKNALNSLKEKLQNKYEAVYIITENQTIEI